MSPHLTPHAVPLIAGALLVACSGPAALAGPAATQLAPCPSAPHCVGSAERDERHATAGFVLAAPAAQAWRGVVQAVRDSERTTVVLADDRYLHAAIVSPWHVYTDDLELLRDGDRVAVRSASRVGWYDFGVNRARVEALRARLLAQGLLR